jgi:hypothetical protein
MNKRGRPSMASLTVSQIPTEIVRRPDAPCDLTIEQSEQWRAIVQAMPSSRQPPSPLSRSALASALACSSRKSFVRRHYLMAGEELMTITKQDIRAVLTRLTEAFPQAFVLEQYQPHRPLKVGIFSEIAARCPDIARSDLATVLNIYTRRMMYLQSLVAGAARVDLDGVRVRWRGCPKATTSSGPA